MTVIENDNEWAVIRLATLQSEKKQPGRLLFASVTLLSPGRVLPTKMDGVDQCSLSNSKSTVFFRRVTLTKESAIEWYRSLGSGDEITPIPSCKDDIEEKYDGIKLNVSPLNDDLIWPHLGLPMGEGLFSHPSGSSHPAPFIGNTYARIHRRFGSQKGFDDVIADDTAVAFVLRRLHINLKSFPEYLGSVAYIAPDPIIKSIDNFMIPSEDDRGERIFYRFIPRQGQTLKGLKLTTFDKKEQLLASFETIDIPDNGILDIEKGQCDDTYGYVVSHPDHGALAYMPATGFIREVNVSTSVIHGSKKIKVPVSNSQNSAEMEYIAEERSPLPSDYINDNDDSEENINVRIAKASRQRERGATAEKYGQRWFDNDSRELAMRFIQNEIKKARSRIIIADPYLASLQLGQFLYAVSNTSVSISLLTSGSAFKESEQTTSNKENFKKNIKTLKENIRITPDVYILPASILHDRFLVIDNTVWFLGNSLNSLGDKSSLVVKLPNPDDVIERLMAMCLNEYSFK